MNQINWSCAACLKQDGRTVSSTFSGDTWLNLTQIQNCSKFDVSVLMRDTCLNIIDMWKKNTTWVTRLLVVVVNIWQAVSFLLLRRQRFITIFKLKGRIENRFLNVFIEIKWLFVLNFSWRTAKNSRTVWGQSVQFFPTCSTCGNET